ncbi:GNAT family N-acetyltransferase [Ideonella azotifigens]|uniref:N-acetyltransferase domain-containing protein n=1 Tax=Ideonella azotifigens TaxID=513160 RepID=A0ABN1KB50_9BURK|nr:GNAT family N-acetyltransferase [Ideonella azotifigens]MCD2344122.1 GNAT family N-acetyltransferase [Ideonella azotifigens]
MTLNALPPASIRPATLADSQAVFEAHQDSVLTLCAGAYTPLQMQTWFEGRTHQVHWPAIQAGQILVAEREGRVLGFAGFVPGEVTLLFVRPEAAGSGLGGQLFRLAMAQAEIGHDGPLTVVATRNSQGFYERHGFVAKEASFFVRGAAELRYEVVNMQRAER